MKTKLLKILIFIIFTSILFLLFYYFDLVNYIESGELRTMIKGYGLMAPLVFVSIYAVSTVLFLPAAPFSLIGGALFGPVLGTTLITAGATLGSFVAFLLARFVFRDLVRRTLLKRFSYIKNFDCQLENKGLLTTAFLRVVVIIPFNVMNFLLGITKVKKADFFLGTMLGIIPAAFVFAYAGDSIMEFSVLKSIISIVLLKVLFISAFLYNKYSKKCT